VRDGQALRFENFTKVSLPKFPLDEQRTISAFLDHETAKIDALVAEQEELITLLKEKRQAVISHAVTKGLNPDAPMKDSGIEWLGEVPAHWDVGALGYLASVETGATPDRDNASFWGGTIPWIKTGEVNYLPIYEAEEFITDLGLENSSTKVAGAGTLLMAMYGQGATRGRVAILEVAAAYNQACAAIVFGDRLSTQYGRYFFIAAYDFVRDFGNETSQMNLSSGIIRKIQLPIPPLAEQAQIVALLDVQTTKIDALVAEAESAAALLKERRSALISAAVTGKINVRGIASSSRISTEAACA
jgi:type I restriction enzyme S subunit